MKIRCNVLQCIYIYIYMYMYMYMYMYVCMYVCMYMASSDIWENLTDLQASRSIYNNSGKGARNPRVTTEFWYFFYRYICIYTHIYGYKYRLQVYWKCNSHAYSMRLCYSESVQLWTIKRVLHIKQLFLLTLCSSDLAQSFCFSYFWSFVRGSIRPSADFALQRVNKVDPECLFVAVLNKLLRKESDYRWFETSWRLPRETPWRHCNELL